MTVSAFSSLTGSGSTLTGGTQATSRSGDAEIQIYSDGASDYADETGALYTDGVFEASAAVLAFTSLTQSGLHALSATSITGA